MQKLFHKVITEMSINDFDFFFIQIGAKDGKRLDPIYKYVIRYSWRGVLVEPVSIWFNKLLKTYKDYPKLKFKNVAICDEDGEKQFYKIRSDNWYLRLIGGSLSSFSLETILKHAWRPGLRSNIVKTTISCMSLESLIREYDIKKINLLVVDTEGYDFNILKQIDFVKIKPMSVFYEHKHLSDIDKQKAESMFLEHGYQVKIGVWNTFVYTVN